MTKCSVESCDRSAYCRTWCKGHYGRWIVDGDLREGVPFRPWRSDPQERFWRKVDKCGPDGIHSLTSANLGPCWLWTSLTCAKGYGRFKVSDRHRQAHRLAYEWLAGPIPEGRELDHLCRVRNCVNPGHLEPIAHSENVARGASGAHWAAKTHCPSGHPYDGENVRVYGGKRNCLICRRKQDRLRAREYRLRKKANA